MKKLLLAVALIAATAFSVSAQSFVQDATLVGGTNNVAATTTNSYTGGGVVAIRSRIVSVQPIFKMVSSSTGTMTFGLDLSTDGNQWVTNSTLITITAAGTALVSSITAVDTGGAAYLRPGQVWNTNAVACTNITVNFGKKLGL